MDIASLTEWVKGIGSLVSALPLPWGGEDANEPTQRKIYNLANRRYGELKNSISDENLRILVHLNSCRTCHPGNLFNEVYRNGMPKFSDSDREFVLKEFVWRLEFLALLGMISRVPVSSYAISHLGKNFVRCAIDAGDIRVRLQ
jgi:hypothetical protein